MKEFFWPMGPKFPNNMLQSSPSSTWVQVWSIEHSCWWHNNITFTVRRLLGDNGVSLLMSLRDSTVRGLQLMIASVSATGVLNSLSLRLWPWVFSKPARILLALRIWHSQTPPICETPGGFLYHVIQSVPFCRRYVSYLFLIHFLQSLSKLLSVPTKFAPLSDLIDLTMPCLAINLHKVWIKESISIVQISSICTALLAKQVNKAQYRLRLDLLSLMMNGPNMSTPQWVNGASFW